MSFTLNERQSLATIASLYLIRMLGLFMVLPVLSLYGTELEGFSPVLIGFALGIYGLAQALFQIPFGWASDRFGRKKVLLAGFLLFISGSLICAFSASIEMLIFGRALQGAGAVSAVLLALLSDWISEQNRTTAMAIVGISIGLSFGISIVLAPIIVSSFGGLSGIFYLSTLLGVIALFLVLFCVPEAQKPNSTSQEVVSRTSLLSPNLLRLDFGIFALHFMQMCIWVVVPGILLGEMGIAIEDHWIVYLAVVGGGFVTMAPFMRFWDKRGATKLSIVVAIICLICSMLLMAMLNSYRFFVFGLFLFFWGFNLLEATLPSSVTKLADPKFKGSAMGVYSSCQFLGIFFGGTVGGLTIAYYGAVSVFYLSALVALIWLAIMLPVQGLEQKK